MMLNSTRLQKTVHNLAHTVTYVIHSCAAVQWTMDFSECCNTAYVEMTDVYTVFSPIVLLDQSMSFVNFMKASMVGKHYKNLKT